MSPGSRRLAAQTTAEVVLVSSLKSCLVNLPGPLVSTLANADAIAQNVAVELRPLVNVAKATKDSDVQRRAIYFGWTGFQSQSKVTPLVDKTGIQGTRGRKDQDVGTIEVDATAARKLDLQAGIKVAVTLHINPPESHTVNIEPLTADDWDILNQHAEFLELNFLSQVRIICNPANREVPNQQPVILHLTATSTVAVKVASIEPQPGSSQPFVKVSPEAEIIVAPKSRASQARSTGHDRESVAGISRRSAGGRSGTSTTRHKSRDEDERRKPTFLRPLDYSVVKEWIDDSDETSADIGLRVWVDSTTALSSPLKGTQWVSVSVMRATGLEEPQSPQTQSASQDSSASAVVARLCIWADPPDMHHAVLSSMLTASLGVAGIVGGIVRIDAAPSQMPRTASIMKQVQPDSGKSTSKETIVKGLKIVPFIATSSGVQGKNLTFGGQSKAEQDKALQQITALFGRSDDPQSIFNGPLTHRMILPAEAGNVTGANWHGGILCFDPAPQTSGTNASHRPSWLLGGERKLSIEVAPAMVKPAELTRDIPGQDLPPPPQALVGIDQLLQKTMNALVHGSSIMLTGGLGSGKTAITSRVLHQVRSEYFFHTLYYPCRKMVTDETRLATIKEVLQRLFARAAWNARLSGKALVVLDDVDKLCPVETELQVGNDNSRSRQLSEILCTIVRRYCTRATGVVLLATAQAKESVNNVVVGGHVVRDILTIKAPDKDGRRRILDRLVRSETPPSTQVVSRPPASPVASKRAEVAWMDGSDSSGPPSVNGEAVAPEQQDLSIDLLDIAGKTDGYYAGDLVLLISRARSEMLIRAVATTLTEDDTITLTDVDFTAALKGFTPASLRNVTLQSSTTTFAAIGGLEETRQILLETLQYPTTYAPIFAKCPLRLRSGLLLYGYPGCGKTMLASAVAGECGLNFISVKGPEILNKYIGASEKSVRDLFDRAEAARPCVLFFDEFDSIAPKRGHDSTGVTDRVVNQLLTQMDGAEGLSGVYVLAATSRPDLIDPALLRPGRLDKSLLCGMPAMEDRLDILKAVSGKLKLERRLTEDDGDESLHEVAKRTEGYSGADLQAVMYNAHLEAIHDMLGDGLEGELGKGKEDKAGSGKHRDFTFFTMGDQEAETGDKQQSPAYLAERAQIAAKLAAMDLAKNKARRMRHAQQSTEVNGTIPNGVRTDVRDVAESQEPVIVWRHILKSLDETRASLSNQERNRLAKVYHEFVAGRSGDMRDGTQGTEIGGRTSLM